MGEESPKNGGGGGQSAGGGRSGKLLSVYVINGRPTRAFNLKLTLAILALRVCKPEGGRRFVTCLGAKEFRWPKVLNGGPKITKQSDGLVKAQPVATVIGESSRGRTRGDSGSLVIVVELESEVCASTSNDDPIQVTSVVSFPIRLEGDHPDEVANLGSEKGLCFGERDNSTVVSSEKGEKWSNPIAKPVSLSYLDGVELLQEGSEHLLLQWKYSEVNPSGFFHGEEESGLLECSPLSKWDPNEQKELKVIQEGDEGEVRGSAVKNSKWVFSLMKIFSRIVGFPIVKHEDQCLALFRLLEQDCIDVVSVGTSKGIVNSKQRGFRELKGLIFSINYDGVAFKGRNKDFSKGMGVITCIK
nr:hypothetical protein CFP56_52659 [Quercus suber]